MQYNTTASDIAPESSDHVETFNVNLRGTTFRLSRGQIESDSPGSNLFAASLLGDFVEASRQTITLDRRPDVFQIILDHLSGYHIFPLDQAVLKACGGMSMQRCLRYIQDDADYYGFARLQASVSEELERVQDAETEFRERTLAIEEQKLEIEKRRIELETRTMIREERRVVNAETLALAEYSQRNLIARLQASATVSANRQVGASNHGKEIEDSLLAQNWIVEHLSNHSVAKLLAESAEEATNQ